MKERWEVPTFKLYFEGAPGVPLLNFEGIPGPRVLGSWPRCYTMSGPGPTFKFWQGPHRTNVPDLDILVPLFHHASFRGVLRKRCSEYMLQIYKRTLWRSLISINLLSNFIEIARQHGCFPVNLVHIFRISFPKNTSGGLLLNVTASQRLFTCQSCFRRSVS